MTTQKARSEPAVLGGAESARALARKGDVLFFIGCLICGTWVLGPIGSPILLCGLWQIRKAELCGATVRPWTVTVIGGLVLIDSAVNYLAWGSDLLPIHDTLVGRTLWVNYGQLIDGGFGMFHNTAGFAGTSIAGEQAIMLIACVLVMPLRVAAAWGFLTMKRWGLQWTIIANYLYLVVWIFCSTQHTLQFEYRFAVSDWGVLGWWMIAGIPFLGPVFMLPYLHTVKRELWTE